MRRPTAAGPAPATDGRGAAGSEGQGAGSPRSVAGPPRSGPDHRGPGGSPIENGECADVPGPAEVVRQENEQVRCVQALDAACLDHDVTHPRSVCRPRSFCGMSANRGEGPSKGRSTHPSAAGPSGPQRRDATQGRIGAPLPRQAGADCAPFADQPISDSSPRRPTRGRITPPDRHGQKGRRPGPTRQRSRGRAVPVILVDDPAQLRRGLGLDRLDRVHVHVERQRHGRMTEPVLDDPRMDAVRSSVALVPQAMERDWRQAGVPHQ